MRRISLWIAATIVLLVLVFSYKTSLSGPAAAGSAAQGAGTQPPGIVGAPAPAATSGTSGSDPSSGPGSPSKPTPTATSAPKASSTVVNGSVAQTRFGPIQVQVTIKSGKITDVRALTYPDSTGRDQEINAYALPVLRREVLAAQSASIDNVSGATYTTQGYVASLQAALDAANLH